MLLKFLPHLRFLTRLGRRQQLLAIRNDNGKATPAQYIIEFDMAAFYDQFGVPLHMRTWYAIHTRDEEGRSAFHALDKLPMGARHACFVAQATLWLALEAISVDSRVALATMIDNVRVATSSPGAFVGAVRGFLGRARDFGMTVTGAERYEEMSDEDILKLGRKNAAGPFTFLGEVSRISSEGHVTFENSEKNVEKLRQAYQTFREWQTTGAPARTVRHVAALVGSILFLAHTLNIPQQRFFTLLRLSAAMANIAAREGWDAPCGYVAPHICRDIDELCDVVLRNTPTTVLRVRPPSTARTDYDTIIWCDASAAGYGAYVYREGRTYALQAGWSARLQHSAHAEPHAGSEILRWCRKSFGPLGNVCFVTDHQAIVGSQRCWESNFGGHSSAFPLNNFFTEFYFDGKGKDGVADRRDVMFVDGTSNIADPLSRACRVGEGLSVTEVEFAFPHLSSLFHPFDPAQHNKHTKQGTDGRLEVWEEEMVRWDDKRLWGLT